MANRYPPPRSPPPSLPLPCASPSPSSPSNRKSPAARPPKNPPPPPTSKSLTCSTTLAAKPPKLPRSANSVACFRSALPAKKSFASSPSACAVCSPAPPAPSPSSAPPQIASIPSSNGESLPPIASSPPNNVRHTSAMSQAPRARQKLVHRYLTPARRNRRPPALRVLELDHFKRYNDTFGRAAGDQALAELG